MVVSTTTYLYVDTGLTQHFAQGTELVDAGPWSSLASYNPMEVVQIGVDQYVALQANTNMPPTGIVDENWSTLVVVEEQSGSTIINAGSDYYARTLAELALETAWVGTAIGSTAYDLVIAETGSRIAADAAIISFVFGSIAVDLAAETGSRIAADLFEAGTRSQADQVLTTALIDETGSRVAADAAIVAFVFGSIAVDLAAETGSRIAADAFEAGTRAQMDQFLYDLILTSSSTAFGSFVDLSGSLAAETASRIASDQQIISMVATGTNVAYSAYALAQTGTNAVITEQGTRSQEDQFLQNQISVLQSILGVSFEGTLSLYTAQVRYGRPDTAFTMIDGVVAGREESKFVWDDFDYYGTTTGTQPASGFDRGSSWDGYGSIYTNNLVVGFNGTDWMNLYPTGTITSTTLNDGTGWASAGTSYGGDYYFHFLGTDTFESYGTGTLSSSGTEINAGGGWVGTAQCYTGSNRP